MTCLSPFLQPSPVALRLKEGAAQAVPVAMPCTHFGVCKHLLPRLIAFSTSIPNESCRGAGGEGWWQFYPSMSRRWCDPAERAPAAGPDRRWGHRPGRAEEGGQSSAEGMRWGPAVLRKVPGQELWGELCAMSGLASLCSSVPSGGTESEWIGTPLFICSYPRSEMQGMSGIAPLEQGLSARIHIPPC